MTQTLDKPAGLPILLNGRQDRPRSFDLADFPSVTGREEEWRFTPVKRLADLLSEEPASASLTVDAQLPDGVTRTTLTAEAARDLGILAPEDRPAALAAAGAPEIVHYAIADGAELDEPVIIRANGTGDGTVHAHTVLTVGAHARATVVIEHEGSARYSELLSVVVGDGAGLTLASLQMWEDGSVHLGQHDALVGRDATYRHIAVSLGGDIVRLNSNVRYTGPGGEAELLGLYFADAGQHLEHRTYIDHTTPKATSNVMYKGALQGTDARTVWVGDVLIRPDALGIDTYELNRNLILTEGARADSVPNLEIETGDIEGAGHASSTGRFDEEHLFYLMSRGIPEEEARRLVVRGFFQEVILKIGIPEIEEVLSQKIEDELSRTVQ
ncbi:MAG TPA: Fe-S cluster assembly protein SufD [Candidatus Brevibacterium intestinigallinarum]|jgi:Fe-S cluster assembly protein SufD|nr:Fe-S cluster assembly protein SufD [Candidatus Brevibacterium intestinigallinarum]